MNSRSESNILTRLIFYSPARQREIIDENVKALHNVMELSQYISSQINI